MPNAVMGELVHAAVVLRRDSEGVADTPPQRAELIEWCRGRLAAYKVMKSAGLGSVNGCLTRDSSSHTRQPLWASSMHLTRVLRLLEVVAIMPTPRLLRCSGKG